MINSNNINTIQNTIHETKMTIFYSKFSGRIEAAFTGVVDFDVFVDRKLEVASYCKKLVLPFNFDLLNRSWGYELDLINNIIVPRKEFAPIPIPIQTEE